MTNNRPAHNTSKNSERIALYFLINLLIATAGPWFIRFFDSYWDHVFFYLIGAVALGLVNRSYGRVSLWGSLYAVYLIWQIILSSIQIAWLVIQPKLKLDPGIIAVPLAVSTDLEITLLASSITLTPGTISVDLGRNPSGQQVLFVHNLTVGDPEAFRRSIYDSFERRILHITRGD